MTDLIEDGPFEGLKKKHYKAILADPAWLYQTRSDKGKDRSPEKHYSCMTLDEIKALPVPELAAKDCVLFMWCIDTHWPQALEVFKAWGFEYKTVGFYWVKTNKDGSPFTGMGHWSRANPEPCLTSFDVEEQVPVFLATKGAPKRDAKDVRRLIMSVRREHSRKPDEIYDRIESLVRGPYLELFARTERDGWDCWGNETKKFKPKSRQRSSRLEALLG